MTDESTHKNILALAGAQREWDERQRALQQQVTHLRQGVAQLTQAIGDIQQQIHIMRVTGTGTGPSVRE